MFLYSTSYYIFDFAIVTSLMVYVDEALENRVKETVFDFLQNHINNELTSTLCKMPRADVASLKKYLCVEEEIIITLAL